MWGSDGGSGADGVDSLPLRLAPREAADADRRSVGASISRRPGFAVLGKPDVDSDATVAAASATSSPPSTRPAWMDLRATKARCGMAAT